MAQGIWDLGFPPSHLPSHPYSFGCNTGSKKKKKKKNTLINELRLFKMTVRNLNVTSWDLDPHTVVFWSRGTSQVVATGHILRFQKSRIELKIPSNVKSTRTFVKIQLHIFILWEKPEILLHFCWARSWDAVYRAGRQSGRVDTGLPGFKCTIGTISSIPHPGPTSLPPRRMGCWFSSGPKYI